VYITQSVVCDLGLFYRTSCFYGQEVGLQLQSKLGKLFRSIILFHMSIAPMLLLTFTKSLINKQFSSLWLQPFQVYEGVRKFKSRSCVSAPTPYNLFAEFWLRPRALYAHAKFQVSSFSHSGDTRWVPKLESRPRDPALNPL